MSDNVKNSMLPVFLLIDTSGSMSGAKIEQVKTALEEIKIQLKILNDELNDSDIKISILTFDMHCKWIAKYKSPDEIISQLELGLITNMGSAFSELRQALNFRQMSDQSNHYERIKCPVIILLTDGMATDDIDAPLKQLKNNQWFLQGYRLAFAIGEDADSESISRFTGSEKTVLEITDVTVISELLSKATHTLSVASGHSNVATELSGNSEERFSQSAKKTEDAIFNNSNTDHQHPASSNKNSTFQYSKSTSEADLFKGWQTS